MSNTVSEASLINSNTSLMRTTYKALVVAFPWLLFTPCIFELTLFSHFALELKTLSKLDRVGFILFIEKPKKMWKLGTKPVEAHQF